MKAIVYNGPRDVSVKNVPDAKIEKPTDALVRVTTTNICGSDLHMYEGRTSFETGRIFGHENMGEVIEVGAGKLLSGDPDGKYQLTAKRSAGALSGQYWSGGFSGRTFGDSER